MRSTFFGLELARLGLWAQQRALDVTGHNIANANTEGYSRQVARLSPTPAYAPPSLAMAAEAGQVGTGVQVAEIQRVRDLFLDRQARDLKAHLGRWQVRSQTLAELETILGEPSDAGLARALADFWDALATVANRPDSLPARTAAIQQAHTLLERFQTADRQLADLADNLDASLVARVDRVNQILVQMADLHRRIRVATAAGQTPNDLLDERDRLLEELGTLLPVRVTERPDGTVRVEVAGLPLVDGQVVHRLAVQEEPAGGAGGGGTGSGTSGGLVVRIYWDGTATVPASATPQAVSGPGASGGAAAAFIPLDDTVLDGGEIDGLLEARDRLVAGLRQDLKALFFALADAVNAVHRQGYGLNDGPPAGSGQQGAGRDLFVVGSGSDLQQVVVNPELDDPANLAAAQMPGAPGDGRNALAMVQLRHAPLNLPGSPSAQDYLESVVAGLGIAGRQAEEGQRTAQLLLDQVAAQRESVRGVSLDEEMTQLIRYQHAYAAAARLVTAVDTMLGILIERTGVVGR
ncbi:flagellar hook-associated protein FlgK [Thermaerobacter marianensis DSM 12885]|uniref:Flagellar hook-associated protein 1 n=1 Tax=Thermaerobacter marianensis (strain ATCC 700841 / DSM 12885 / JCM 10246 / 7p75a) TaxID=644966 RepID=E6SLQ2_THEM7|nr:flagellar hook-associated protein FlgK [Thermaerobacter marianensis]ADU50319.1 flagellar hook-associated protein FlgK [Thermaerobacter marianensis DSM 12885]